MIMIDNRWVNMHGQPCWRSALHECLLVM